MWTQKIVSGKKDLLTFDISVEFYKNGVLFATHPFEKISNKTDIRRLVNDQLEQYKKNDEVDISSLIGNLDLNPPVEVIEPEEKPKPTKEDLEKDSYFEDFRKLQKLKDAVRFGMIEASTDEIQMLEIRLKENYKEEYLKEL